MRPDRVAVACLIAVAAAGVLAAADRDASFAPFSTIAEQAARRCVKLIGAGAGREHGYACGLIVSADGRILAANGVALAASSLRAVLADGSTHAARVVRRSDDLHCSLLQIDAPTPDHWTIDPDVRPQAGDWALAVGNPFKVAAGAERLSLIAGVVSARCAFDVRHRRQDVAYGCELLLIDAITSNAGSPGGAVVGYDGRLLGMTGRLIESEDAGTRLNYAVPADVLARFLAGDAPAAPTAATGARPWTGVRLFLHAGRRAPAYVDSAAPGSPAAAAGLRKDDLILAVGNRSIGDCREWQEVEATLKPGDQVRLALKRGAAVVQVALTVAAVPEAGDGQ